MSIAAIPLALERKTKLQEAVGQVEEEEEEKKKRKKESCFLEGFQKRAHHRRNEERIRSDSDACGIV